MKIERDDEALANVELPELRAVDNFSISGGDVLVTCAGFEDRAFEFLRRAVKAGSSGFEVLAIEYLPSLGANRRDELEAIASDARATLRWLIYDREDPADPTDDIFRYPRDGRQLYIDTSGMSRLLIVQLVVGAIRSGLAGGTTLIYAEADHYPPSKDEVELTLANADEVFGVINFISSGVFEIIVRPELSTTAMYGQPIHVITFPTFNPAQLAAVCAEVNASAFTVVNGMPAQEGLAWRLEAIRKLNRVTSLREAEERTSSTLDYRETVALLLDVYRQHGARQKLVVVPTGSKMQSVAVGIVVGFLNDFQVVYPAPRSFTAPANYTRGARMIYSLDLGAITSSMRQFEPHADDDAGQDD